MDNKPLTFLKFNDPELAAIIAAHLKAQGISSQIVNESPNFDVTFANNDFEQTVHLKLLPADFNKARTALEQYYQQQLTSIDPDYYLFSFSDTELLDIVKHPDEWGMLDYALAKKILAEHGKPVTSFQETDFQQHRLTDLAQPEKSSPPQIIAGYIAAFFFPFAGIILGYILTYLKKTLPDGQQVYTYSLRTRTHGRRILILSTIVFTIWLLLFLNNHLAIWTKPL